MPASPSNLSFPRPLVTVDIAIFAVRGDRLHVLLVRRGTAAGEPFPGRWALPGGFVDVQRDESLESCAMRKLEEKTGVRAPYLEQLGSWGGKDRDPRGWSVTQAYFALIAPDEGEALDAESRWEPIAGRGVRESLAFDHDAILEAALVRLRGKVEYTSLPAFLLPKEFTLTELQRAYEAVLGRKLDKSAFRTRVLAADLVQPLERMREGPNRPAQLYRLKSRRAPVYFQRTFKPE